MSYHKGKTMRPSMFMGFLITAAMLILALFMQYEMGLEPCPLCIVQRAVVIALGIIFFIGFLQNPATWGRRIYGFVLSIISVLGLFAAGRHTWLQHLPQNSVPECGPGLEYWMNKLPAMEVLEKIFLGSGECAEISYKFIGLSIAEWSLIAFIFFFAYSLKLLFLGR